MKKLLLSISLITLTAFAALPDGTIQLGWTAPSVAIGDVDSFVIRYSYNVSTPITNWIVATNFAAVVNNQWVTSQWVTIPTAGKCFFFITSSNFWGDSITWSSISNITNTPAVGANPQQVFIKSR